MNTKITKLLFIFAVILSTIILISIHQIYNIKVNSDSLQEYQKNSSKMFDKINELRQNIDNMTRFARTYVITKDKIYKTNYYKILKIRDGKISKPESYLST